ncbi:IclR family transcriptional regulator [Pandoraea cepalis]|uniref:IclR family transcriptional regulator n=1 Tax=Pandoraea cepalis TaxID=2508294 RepID=A0AAW7MNU6_9BURK|nr:IclR family transcriptional regulator [Pandoraea cepalis]MDN4574226.1 IclR family transcriptional regulator [Pandoraea cepalis]MDN4579729.1 IclR family transcriptional regulator [Pandoraea cepalis]
MKRSKDTANDDIRTVGASNVGERGERGEPGGDELNTSSTSIISLRILELLAERNAECGVTHLAEALGVPKARVHRHLTALRQEGYVIQNPRTSRYRIGWRLFLLGQKLVKQFDVVGLARPVMEELRDAVGQTIVISSFTETEVVVLDVMRGRSPLEILLHPGTQFKLHSVAQGKIALAFGSPERRDAVLAGPLEACTPHTITDPMRLSHELALVRERGWADAPEEVFLGVNALAAPIVQDDGSLFGTLAIVGSIHYLPAHPNSQTVAALTDAARRISRLLGGARAAE